jgi:AraC family transcriptional regulator
LAEQTAIFNPPQDFRLIQHQALPGFILNESVSEPAARTPRHTHDQAHLTLIVAGHCWERYQGLKRELSPLTVIYFHPGESHAIDVFNQPLRTFDLELKADWLADKLAQPIAPTALLDNKSRALAGLATRLYREFKEPDDVAQLAMEGLTLEILAALARISTPGKPRQAPPWLRQVVEQIHAGYATTLTLQELARTAGVHPSYLVEVFRTHQQCTPGEFIRRVRIEQAIQQMANVRLSLADIAFNTGFTDQSHFTRIFKRATGLTPAQYRQLKFGTKPMPTTRILYKTKQ